VKKQKTTKQTTHILNKKGKKKAKIVKTVNYP